MGCEIAGLTMAAFGCEFAQLIAIGIFKIFECFYMRDILLKMIAEPSKEVAKNSKMFFD